MWPFSKSKRKVSVPTVRCGETVIRWHSYGWWEFGYNGYDYTLIDTEEFNPEILSKISRATDWIRSLDSEINKEIERNLAGWCKWNGEKHIVSIDVSSLLLKDTIDVSYAGNDDWGDLGINIVIINGIIDHSYAGD
jgi:hypothetical protein